MKRIDSRNVAERAGVSQSTVSKVLSGRYDSRLSEATRKKVLDAVQELNYAPNMIARALVTGKTHRLGIVTNTPQSLTNLTGYHLGILSGALYGAVDNNYNLLLHSSQYPTWRALYDDISGGGADGVLLLGDYPESALAETLVAEGFPTVFISHCPKGERGYAVDCDNVQGGYLAAKHLIETGRTKIAFLSNHTTTWAEERKTGVENAVREANAQGKAVHLCSHLLTQGADEAVKILSQSSSGSWGVVTADEALGILLSEALFAEGRGVPEEVAIVNFNSTEASANARVPLTSIYQPLCEIGFVAVTLLANLLGGEDLPPGVRRVSVRLDIRESSGGR